MSNINNESAMMGMGKCSERTPVPVRLRVLCILLENAYWTREVLAVHVLSCVRALVPVHVRSRALRPHRSVPVRD